MTEQGGRIVSPVTIQAAWVDASDNLRPAFYTAAFDGSIDDLKAAFGLDAAWRAARRQSTVALEARLSVRGPARRGEVLRIESRIFDVDAKRLHIAQVLARGEDWIATRESMAISFDLDARRSCPFAPEIATRIAALYAAHRALEPWDWVGQQACWLADLDPQSN